MSVVKRTVARAVIRIHKTRMRMSPVRRKLRANSLDLRLKKAAFKSAIANNAANRVVAGSKASQKEALMYNEYFHSHLNQSQLLHKRIKQRKPLLKSVRKSKAKVLTWAMRNRRAGK